MYAVIETGGKQYRVQQGQRLKVEKIERATGDSIEFDKVLLVSGEEGAKIGKPYLEGGKVTAEVVAQGHRRQHRVRQGVAGERRRGRQDRQALSGRWQGDRRSGGPGSPQEDRHHQVPAPQAPPEACRPPAVVYRNQDYRHQRLS